MTKKLTPSLCNENTFAMWYKIFVTLHVETVVMLSHKKPDNIINVKVEFGEGEGKVPLDNIGKRAEAYKLKDRVTYKPRKHPTAEKVEAIRDALKHFEVI